MSPPEDATIVTTGADATALTAAIAAFAAGTEGAAMPESARHVMRLSMLDWCAVALAGRGEPVSGIVRAMAGEEGGRAEAGVFGLAARLPARAAALVNGTTSHALDYDDTHFGHVGHPSVAVLPAACAVAERVGAPGPALLEAALVGVEVACRTGAWLGRRHYNHGFHQTATSGTFGATAAAARLLGLDADGMAGALGVATTRASGLKSQFGTMGKPYNAGIAAANGVEAATLAARGFVSRPDGLECAQGFGATHAGEDGPLGEVLAALGSRYVFETVQHKFHACCHGTHAALEAIATLRDAHRLAPEAVEAVALTVNPRWLKVCDIPAPTTGLEAKFSYRLTAAMALAGRDTGALTTFSDAACADPALLALRDRVRVRAHEAVTDTGAEIRITLRDGTSLDSAHDLDRAIPAATREARIRAKAAALLGEDAAETIWERIAALETATPPFALDRLATLV